MCNMGLPFEVQALPDAIHSDLKYHLKKEQQIHELVVNSKKSWFPAL